MTSHNASRPCIYYRCRIVERVIYFSLLSMVRPKLPAFSRLHFKCDLVRITIMRYSWCDSCRFSQNSNNSKFLSTNSSMPYLQWAISTLDRSSQVMDNLLMHRLCSVTCSSTAFIETYYNFLQVLLHHTNSLLPGINGDFKVN